MTHIIGGNIPARTGAHNYQLPDPWKIDTASIYQSANVWGGESGTRAFQIRRTNLTHHH